MNNQGNCQDSYRGNSVDICTDCLSCESEIRADVTLARAHSIRVWGQIRECDGSPVEDALIKLIEVTECNGQCVLNGIAHTVSDCQGFYQFDLCTENPCAKYKILVGAVNAGAEKVVGCGCGCGNCAPCYQEPPCAPCHPGGQDKCDSSVKVPAVYGCTQAKRC